jgi:hypothetical protein
LVLAYYYCCSADPCVAIFNDELKPDVDTSVIRDCISNLIGNPIGQEEAMLCQETFNNLDQSHARIAACASCCKCLLSADGQQEIVVMKIDDLPSELDWEFRFLVPASGTLIRSGIPISFLIPKIPVGIFLLNSAVEKSTNWNSDSKIWNSPKN